MMKNAMRRVDEVGLTFTQTNHSPPPTASGSDVVFFPLPVQPADNMTRREMILVVDDEPAILAVMRIALEKSGFQVVVAGNGAEALAKFEVMHDKIRVLITDMAMPGMNGLDLIRTIRELNDTVEIVATTGMTTMDQMQAIREAGVIHVLSKPCGSRQLLEMVRKFFPKP